MELTESPMVVCDAGPIIHLDELDCLNLLAGFSSVLVPSEVARECEQHRPDIARRLPGVAKIVSEIPRPSIHLQSLATSLGLAIGEVAAISLMEHSGARILLCDDAAARLAAESMGFRVHGTMGLLIRAIRAGTKSKPEVVHLLGFLPQRSTLHISRRLLRDIIQQVSESGHNE